MSDYWVYGDMTVHTATVHRAACRYCNNGAGMGRGRIARDSRWLGPYNSVRAAKRAPIRANSNVPELRRLHEVIWGNDQGILG